MLKVRRVQGVTWQAGLSRDIPITEYEPKKLKWRSLETETPAKNKSPKCCKTIIRFETITKNLDSTDGLAAAVCHFFNSGKS